MNKPPSSPDKKSVFPQANPILVFELRQIVRNRTILLLMGVYLLVLVSFLGIALAPGVDILDLGGGLLRSFFSFYMFDYNMTIAVIVLLFYYFFTTITLVGFAAGRTVSDRLHENPVFYSTLPPRRIVTGKLQFAAVTSLLLLCLTLPFLSTTFLMRGVDLRTLLFMVLILYCLTLLQFSVTVAFYSGAVNTARVILLTLPLGLIHFLLGLFGLFVSSHCAYEISVRGDTGFFWVLAGLFLAFMLAAGVLSLVQFSPPSSNRMLPVRIAASAVQFLFVALVCCFGARLYLFGTSDFGEAICLFYLAFGSLFPYLFFVFVCEREHWSIRIRRTIPRSFLGRLFVFPFYTGAVNATAWCLMTFGIQFIILQIFLWFDGTYYSWRFNYEGELRNVLGAGLLFFDYCATLLLLYDLGLHRRISRQWLWVPLFAFFGGIVISFIMLVFAIEVLGLPLHGVFERLVYDLDWLWFLPNPLFWDDGPFIKKQTFLAVVWFLLLVLLRFRWMVRNFQAFRTFDPEEERPEPPIP